jgi:hypothetical protein
MAVTGVSNLAELISNEPLGQGQAPPDVTQSAKTQGLGAAVPTQDSFTPSAQNNSAQATAQDAGLFQVSQFALSSATADVLTAQAAPPQPAQLALAGTTDVATSQAAPPTALNVQTPAPPAPAPIPADTPALPTPVAAPQATSSAAAATAITPGQLQSLNEHLLGLGLSNSDIQDIDRIASVAKNSNPAVYNDLIQQFEAQAAQQTALAAGGSHQAAQPKVPTT